jgi:AraC-like DNA-binding protein
MSIIEIISRSHVDWKQELPKQFPIIRFPGASVYTAEADFGTVCVQRYEGTNYHMDYSIFSLQQQIDLTGAVTESGLYTRIVLSGLVRQKLDGSFLIQRKNQFLLFKTPFNNFTSLNYSAKLHICFEAFFSLPLIQELFDLFPALKLLFDRKEFVPGPIKLHSPIHVDIETHNIVNKVLKCPYEKDLRTHYFDSRVRDLLFNLLVQASNTNPVDNDPDDFEMAAIRNAQDLINADIKNHFQVPELAKKVLLGQTRFKLLFKKIFNMGPYEYLQQQRMIKAKELLEQGMQVKEVAALTGYRLTRFINAFRNYYGTTPGSLLRKPK